MLILYRARKLAACLTLVCLVGGVVIVISENRPPIELGHEESLVEISLIDLPPNVAPAEPLSEPLDAQPQIDEPIIAQVPEPLPKPRIKPSPRPVVAPSAPVAAQQQSSVDAPVVKSDPRPVASAPVPANRVALEGSYITALRKELENLKQYPRGREASLQRPQGDVVVWLEVDRLGNVLDSGIDSRARNMLLNRAAQGVLQRLQKVSPFPPDAFAGKEKQRFTATFSYSVE